MYTLRLIVYKVYKVPFFLVKKMVSNNLFLLFIRNYPKNMVSNNLFLSFIRNYPKCIVAWFIYKCQQARYEIKHSHKETFPKNFSKL